MRHAVVVVGLFLSSGGALRAQPLTQRDVGTRVHVETTAGEHIRGTLTAIERDTLRVIVGGVEPPFAFALAAVKTVARFEGYDRERGAVHGLLNGGKVGLVLIGVGLFLDRGDSGDNIVSASMLTVPAAVIVTLIGAGAGALSAPERWGVPQRVSLRLDATPARGAYVGLTVRF